MNDLNSMRVLLIEDQPEDAFLVQKILRRDVPEGTALEVDHAGTLADGIEMLQKEKYSCALLDLGLPDGRGLNNLRRIRNVDETLPVVVLSGIDDEQTAASAVLFGAHAYIVKKGINDSDNIYVALIDAVGKRHPRPQTGTTAELKREGRFRLNGANRIIGWDEHCEALLKWTYPEVQLRPFLDLVTPARREEIGTILERPNLSGRQTLKLKLQRSDGSKRLVEIRPELSVHGAKERQWVMTDAETARRAHQAMQILDTVLKATGDMVASQDLQGVIHTCNPSSRLLLDRTPSEIVGHRFDELFVDADKPKARAILGAMRRGHSARALSVHLLNNENKAVPVVINAAPVRDELGGLIGACFVARGVHLPGAKVDN